MPGTDRPDLDPAHIRQALGLLSRLPVTSGGAPHDAARAAWAYPVAGLILGGLAALAGLVAHWLGMAPALTAVLVLGVMILSTGAMHEDGLADTADGLGGGWTRERRLEIMKDSHIGTYGVLALILAFAARWAALWMLFQAGPGPAAAAIMVAATVSRGMMPALMATLPPARSSGLSHGVGQVTPATAWVAAGIGIAAALILTGLQAPWALIWAGGAMLVMRWLAQATIGGQTGDILGATQQVAEVAVLASLAT